jgi:hypothetical protein
VKYIKMLGLAALAAAALTAFVGVGSASATILCHNSSNPCTSDFVAGEFITGNASGATLTNNLSNVSCKTSETKVEVTNTGGSEATVTGKVTALNFKSCSTFGFIPCTVTVNNLPYHAEAHATSGGNGTLTVTAGEGGGEPGASVNCSGIINCTFGEELFNLPITGGNPASVTATKVKLTRTGGECPEEAFWDATYKSTAGVWAR